MSTAPPPAGSASSLAALNVDHPALSLLPVVVRLALVQRLTGGKLDLPVLPTVATEVLTLTQSATTDAARLSALIHRDQALASHLLRIANSAAYRGRAPIVSLQQAVARLGFEVLAEIVLAVSVKANVFRAPGFEDALRAQWRHAALAGAFAKEIARTRRQNVEGAFLSGLLHDIGRPVLLSVLVELARAHQQALSQDALTAVMDALHAELGGTLARAWNLPEATAESLRSHHTPDQATTAHDLVHTTTLSDHLAHWAAEDGAADEEAIRALPQVAQLNLYPDMMDALLAHKERALAFAEALA